ncbi:3-oxoacyl-[acyl-carrier protein] reductase [Saccharopolyspora antimicrobica]|uniref:3-oxoacyl-[acyl-carrier protein] reductase n=1 Tax=Saccharopolyspora antimicrobica TaxID=455193 RepID=A0A1I5AAA6_9PSEU|nr:SDR family oxidoreductase [Saccharopolyspora antimicrobica]RKT83213.1 3-oxoacyl-[acyl-carrier protein] reductase [Saccharopolyspora antimicrobica]SFN59405.1 3-oxoacyl-[acyl-carrier protein] reductase [Saccharopolyspora antimicrobica]
MPRSALVTGSSRAASAAIAERVGADGLSVVVNYRSDRAAAGELVAGIEAGGGRAVAAQADVTDPAQLRALFDFAEQQFGGLDVLVNNVGTARFAPIAESTDADYDLLFGTNTRTAFTALREAANRLRDGGRIVAISSGVTANHRPGTGLYGAAKAAVDQLVRVLARELGPRGITVNSVRPGATRTDALLELQPEEALQRMAAETPLGRIGEPADIADLTAFLVSDDARWITGQIINAGGGNF